MYVWIHVCLYRYLFVYMYICMHIFVCIYVCELFLSQVLSLIICLRSGWPGFQCGGLRPLRAHHPRAAAGGGDFLRAGRGRHILHRADFHHQDRGVDPMGCARHVSRLDFIRYLLYVYLPIQIHVCIHTYIQCTHSDIRTSYLVLWNYRHSWRVLAPACGHEQHRTLPLLWAALHVHIREGLSRRSDLSLPLSSSSISIFFLWLVLWLPYYQVASRYFRQRRILGTRTVVVVVGSR